MTDRPEPEIRYPNGYWWVIKDPNHCYWEVAESKDGCWYYIGTESSFQPWKVLEGVDWPDVN